MVVTEDAACCADPAAFWKGDACEPGRRDGALAAHAAVQAEPWISRIVDEAYHVKNCTASFKLVDGLKSRFLLLLTATPIETELEELYNLVTLLKPGQFATPAAFRAVRRQEGSALAKNRERLRGLPAEVMVRNTRADGLAPRRRRAT